MTEPNIYVIEPQTGYWLATIPAVMGCNASGKTRDEAIANVRKTFTAYLELLSARGVSNPLPFSLTATLSNVSAGCGRWG